MPGITLDFANCLSDRVKEHGLTESDIADAKPRFCDLSDRLTSMRLKGKTAYRDLPHNPARSKHLNAIKAIVDHYRDKDIRNLVVLGIGGSALGNIALHTALNPLTYNLLADKDRPGPRLFILDNVDPHMVRDVKNYLQADDPEMKHTLINVISKSGETAETAAQFIVFRDLLQRFSGNRSAEYIVAVTDEKQGTMRSIVDSEGYRNLPVPDGVGGRFSVLSPVGLFSAAMCGIDIQALLEGAASMDEPCSEADLEKNPAGMLAFILIELTRRGKPNHVLMPYSNNLYSLADWFRQIWAESLGKQYDLQGKEVFAGATPIKALGTTDQHSQIQLYREGPNDKVIGFLEVEQFDGDVTIPASLEVQNLKYLQNATFSQLLNAEKRATEYALVESRRPNYTLKFPRIDAYHVGQFIYLWEVATSYAGLMLNIDAYNQPAVETGKKATFGLMGRIGFEEYKSQVDATLAPTDHLISCP